MRGRQHETTRGDAARPGDVPLILVRLAAEAATAEEAENYQHQDDDQNDQQDGERWPPSGDGLLDVQSNLHLDH